MTLGACSRFIPISSRKKPILIKKFDSGGDTILTCCDDIAVLDIKMEIELQGN